MPKIASHAHVHVYRATRDALSVMCLSLCGLVMFVMKTNIIMFHWHWTEPCKSMERRYWCAAPITHSGELFAPIWFLLRDFMLCVIYVTLLSYTGRVFVVGRAKRDP